jgi:hypothetical protein
MIKIIYFNPEIDYFYFELYQMDTKNANIYIIVFLLMVLAGCGPKKNAIDEKPVTPIFSLLLPTQTNISFENTLTEGPNTNILMYEYFYNGAGVAAGDFNNDGLMDLYFTGNMVDNKLYLNKGNFTFEDITSISGASGRPGPWKTGVNVVDINGDGKLDIYVCYSGALPEDKRANQLFLNIGNNSRGVPSFEEKAAEYGLESTGFSNQSYFFDYDKDGDLDMLLLNHNPKNLPILNEASTARLFKQDSPDKGLRLFKQTNGKFQDVTISAGINGSELSYGLGLGIADFNKDGWPDFYLSNDYAVPDYLYINNQNGTFTNKITSSIGHTSQFSMGNDVADINNDGQPDIFTLDMLPEDNHRQKLLLTPDNYNKFNQNLRTGFYYQYMRNMLQLNNGNGTFSEIGQLAGISNTDWSWSALLADYDNDGWKDLYVTNGYLRDYTNLDFINYMNDYVKEKGRLQREDVMNIIKEMPASNVVNYMFQNKQGNGFKKMNDQWGFTQPSNSNGAVYADLDNDGDLDLVVNNINQPAFVYKNEARTVNANHYLQFNLTGTGANTQGLGTSVAVYNKEQVQLVEQNPARGYLSSVSGILQVGMGAATQADSIIITWSSGKSQRLYNQPVNRRITLLETDAKESLKKPVQPTTWFTTIAVPFSNSSIDTSIIDFNRQPLLIGQFSQTASCLTQADLNNDGLQDMLIGGQPGQPARIYLQQKNGSFLLKPTPVFDQDKKTCDAAIAVLDANKDGLPDIYIASGGYHNFTENDTALQDRLYLNDGKNGWIKSNGLPAIVGSKSCVSIQDINNDGSPDIFVGGRVVPGRYPQTPPSFILINDGKGNFSNQIQNICPELAKAGMVTDAVWVDLDNDKTNELVIAGEWMPVSVYKNAGGKLVNSTSKFFDKPYFGWWNKIAVGDFNKDGKPDLMVGNMGLNSQFKASETEPVEMFYKDFDNNGSVDPICSIFNNKLRYPYLTMDELLGQLPIMRKKFNTYKTYADATLEDIFSPEELKSAGHLKAEQLATTCLLSTATGKFTISKLPPQAQYAPVYSITQLDFNGDGNPDLLLCGNNSTTKIRLGKFDANYGVLLQGNGKGGFTYIPQTQSGFNIWGDVRAVQSINNHLYFSTSNKGFVAYTLASKTK